MARPDHGGGIVLPEFDATWEPVGRHADTAEGIDLQTTIDPWEEAQGPVSGIVEEHDPVGALRGSPVGAPWGEGVVAHRGRDEDQVHRAGAADPRRPRGAVRTAPVGERLDARQRHQGPVAVAQNADGTFRLDPPEEAGEALRLAARPFVFPAAVLEEDALLVARPGIDDHPRAHRRRAAAPDPPGEAQGLVEGVGMFVAIAVHEEDQRPLGPVEEGIGIRTQPAAPGLEPLHPGPGITSGPGVHSPRIDAAGRMTRVGGIGIAAVGPGIRSWRGDTRGPHTGNSGRQRGPRGRDGRIEAAKADGRRRREEADEAQPVPGQPDRRLGRDDGQGHVGGPPDGKATDRYRGWSHGNKP